MKYMNEFINNTLRQIQNKLLQNTQLIVYHYKFQFNRKIGILTWNCTIKMVFVQ